MRRPVGHGVHLAILAGTAALAVAACGGVSDEDRAIGAAEDFFAALRDVDAERACELNLGSDGQPLSEEHDDWQTCLDGVDAWAANIAMPPDGKLAELSFDSAEIDGDHAHIPHPPPAEYVFARTFDLRKVDKNWYVDGAWYL